MIRRLILWFTARPLAHLRAYHKPLTFHRKRTTWQLMKALKAGAQPRVK